MRGGRLDLSKGWLSRRRWGGGQFCLLRRSGGCRVCYETFLKKFERNSGWGQTHPLTPTIMSIVEVHSTATGTSNQEFSASCTNLPSLPRHKFQGPFFVVVVSARSNVCPSPLRNACALLVLQPHPLSTLSNDSLNTLSLSSETICTIQLSLGYPPPRETRTHLNTSPRPPRGSERLIASASTLSASVHHSSRYLTRR